VKFLSSLIQIGLFTAENAGQKNDRLEGDIKLLMLNIQLYLFYIFSFTPIFGTVAVVSNKT
jgi:hypothetical protein